jgi:hypothetical protein
MDLDTLILTWLCWIDEGGKSGIAPKSEGWIPEEEWEHIQCIMPIVCVDVLPICYAPTGQMGCRAGVWSAAASDLVRRSLRL